MDPRSSLNTCSSRLSAVLTWLCTVEMWTCTVRVKSLPLVTSSKRFPQQLPSSQSTLQSADCLYCSNKVWTSVLRAFYHPISVLLWSSSSVWSYCGFNTHLIIFPSHHTQRSSPFLPDCLLSWGGFRVNSWSYICPSLSSRVLTSFVPSHCVALNDVFYSPIMTFHYNVVLLSHCGSVQAPEGFNTHLIMFFYCPQPHHTQHKHLLVPRSSLNSCSSWVPAVLTVDLYFHCPLLAFYCSHNVSNVPSGFHVRPHNVCLLPAWLCAALTNLFLQQIRPRHVTLQSRLGHRLWFPLSQKDFPMIRGRYSPITAFNSCPLSHCGRLLSSQSLLQSNHQGFHLPILSSSVLTSFFMCPCFPLSHHGTLLQWFSAVLSILTRFSNELTRLVTHRGFKRDFLSSSCDFQLIWSSVVAKMFFYCSIVSWYQCHSK